MSFFELSNGEYLYYEDTEKGDRTIVMLHGWTSSHEVYADIVPRVKNYARCITYDHRGHMKSKLANKDQVTLDTLAGDLNELINGLGLKDITLLGWSMGAATVMNYISLYGCSTLRQVVLCDMTPRQINDQEWKLGLYKGKYTKENVERELNTPFYDLYKDFAIGAIPKLARIPGFLLRLPLKKRLQACDEKVVRSLARSMKEKDFRDIGEKITVPVNYIYAVPGSLFSPDLADWYREHIHTSFKAFPIQDSTHMLITDQPEQFSEAVIQVLEG